MLHLVVFSISFSLIFLICIQKSTRDKLPPGEKGWPIIGETLEFAGIGQKGTPKMFVMDKMRKYSQDLFKTSMFRENMVACCGASGQKFLFSNEKKCVVTW
ncbi:beta-amyrin 28-monooxygenase [Quercus suber]|uniref:Beta-amyrin 28-monooxygenase n=1 Tax=Quercus suber TaxID=58331 RepID=A0AAW0IMC7_QUESU